ncbi:MAG: hypothetical protein AB8I08_29750 [Sandaracinaceae bacterium]
MAKSDQKFGTFGGVFTPSILTILGVIMYLRLPWIVGNAGLVQTIGIVMAAHVVSICTGLSISSIATDKSVGAGGPYYIVSRSLGLPIGGTLGLALFLGLSFSISLYIIGFSESMLASLDIEATKNAIRVCGTLTVVLLTVITFISTSLAIKTQYIILGLIALSIVAIFFGSPAGVEAPLLSAPDDGEALPLIFGIFFPAVTGFTAGVNMSGDLRDPKSAIPTGTMAAIAVGLVVYIALAIFLALRVPQDALVNNPRVLEELAVWAPAVTAGIWGATLSSALGSILGAPRILQTISADGITPRWFARGYGPTNEPRNALLLAFVIGWAGILIAELDVIARVVSIVFMATYGFLNAAAAIESWVSPDFRPDFRIPKTISVVGATICLLLMIVMDVAAMAGATVLMAGLYVYLQRRQLRLESGDAWEGIWSSLVRAGLHRLARVERQHRNWRPNILMFRPDDGEPREALRRTARTLIAGSGMLTDVVLHRPGQKAEDDKEEDDAPVGHFSARVGTDDRYATIETIAQHHGYSGLEPNTVLLDWDASHEDNRRFATLIDRLRALDLNTLLYSDATHDPPPGTPARIDVWYRAHSTPSLGISLLRFITASNHFRNAELRFLTVSRDSAINDALKNAARRMLEQARVTAEVEVILDSVEPREFEEWVSERSADALLAVVELPDSPIEGSLPALDGVREQVPSVLFVAPNQNFASFGRVARGRSQDVDERELEAGEEVELPPLEVAEIEGIGPLAEAFSERLETTAADLFEQGIARAAARNRALLERNRELLHRHFTMLVDGLDEPNPIKRRRTVNRVQSAFLMETGKRLEEFLAQDLIDQRDILEGRIDGLLDDVSLVDADGVVTLSRAAADFSPTPGDSRELSRFKATRRKRADGGTVRYDVDTTLLQRFHVDALVAEVASDAVRGFAAHSWSVAIQLGRVLNTSRTSLRLLEENTDLDTLRAFVEKEQEGADERIEELMGLDETRMAGLRRETLYAARQLGQAFTDDLAAIDIERTLKTKRRLYRNREATRIALRELPESLFTHQRALLQRAQIGLKVSAFQHRLATIVQRTEEALTLEVKNGVLHGYSALRDQLATYLEEPGDDAQAEGEEGENDTANQPLRLKLEISHRFDPQRALDSLLREGQRSAEDLPEITETLSDDSIAHLSEGDDDDVEMVELPLRRMAQFLLEAELVGPLTELLSRLPAEEQRAVGVAEDVVRLIRFHQNEYDPEGNEQTLVQHTRPVVENGLGRIEEELGPLQAVIPSIHDTLSARLGAVLRGTDVYELTGSAQALGQHIRRHQGQRAVSGAQSLLLSGVARVRKALVSAVYGQSAGLLLARRLKDTPGGGALVDRVLHFVAEQAAKPGVLEDLPFYYRQLFFGKNTLNETFWVEREHEMGAARRGITQHDRGGSGVLIVTGEPDSGKTALCRRIASRVLSSRNVVWMPPPEAGSASADATRADPQVFRDQLAKATGRRGESDEILASLPERSVVVIEDLELYWERSPDGLEVIDELIGLFERHSGRVLFMIEVGQHPFSLINRFRPLADHALSVVECGPVSAESLKDIVMLRHGSTGMSFEIDGVAEDELSEWRMARLFSAHFRYSRGLVGPALTSWITHTDEADDRVLRVRTPERRGWEVLDRLRAEWVALLVQLLLHKRMRKDRLLHVSGLAERELDAQLDVLRRMGLVQTSAQGVLSLTRNITHALTERLRERRVIP